MSQKRSWLPGKGFVLLRKTSHEVTVENSCMVSSGSIKTNIRFSRENELRVCTKNNWKQCLYDFLNISLSKIHSPSFYFAWLQNMEGLVQYLEHLFSLQLPSSQAYGDGLWTVFHWYAVCLVSFWAIFPLLSQWIVLPQPAKCIQNFERNSSAFIKFVPGLCATSRLSISPKNPVPLICRFHLIHWTSIFDNITFSFKYGVSIRQNITHRLLISRKLPCIYQTFVITLQQQRDFGILYC